MFSWSRELQVGAGFRRADDCRRRGSAWAEAVGPVGEVISRMAAVGQRSYAIATTQGQLEDSRSVAVMLPNKVTRAPSIVGMGVAIAGCSNSSLGVSAVQRHNRGSAS